MTNSVHVVIPPKMLEDAEPGNRRANAMAFAFAASIFEAGHQLPPELARWLAIRLRALSGYLEKSNDDPKLDGLARALFLVKSSRGRRKAGRISRDVQELLCLEVQDAYLHRGQSGYPPKHAPLVDIFEFVSRRRETDCMRLGRMMAAAGITVNTSHILASPSVVEAAWKKRRQLIQISPIPSGDETLVGS